MAVAAADMRQHGRVRDGLERARLGRASLLAWSALGVAVFAALVFWFDPAQVRDPTTWTGLGAYDAGGKRLPDGHIELFTY